jgi:FMN reductase
MANVVVIVGSPSEPSRTAFVLRHLADRLRREGHTVTDVVVRDLPAGELVEGRVEHPAVTRAVAAVESADGVVVATPIYKASFSGVLKVFLDVLPQRAFRGKPVQAIGTAGSAAHLLAIDYALGPVLAALGAEVVLPAYVDVTDPSARTELSAQTSAKLDELAQRLARCLRTP